LGAKTTRRSRLVTALFAAHLNFDNGGRPAAVERGGIFRTGV